MADALRITVDELKRRMETGEDFTLIDVRNPQAWAESDTMLQAIRVPSDKLEENLPRIPRNRPVWRTALDRTKALAPVWRGNSSNAGTKMCGRFRADSEHGRTLDCRSRQNGRQLRGLPL